MNPTCRLLAGTLFAVLSLAAGPGPDGSIQVPEGEVREEMLTSLNGPIQVGADATVRDCRSVNGPIVVGDDARTGDLSAVNGPVEVGSGSKVGDVSSVNGGVSLERNAVAAEVRTVNGPIDLAGAEVSGDVRTINGDVTLTESAKVRGDVVFEGRHRNSERHGAPLRVRITDGSVVEGGVIVEDADLEVEVILSGGGRVLGRVEGAKVVED